MVNKYDLDLKDTYEASDSEEEYTQRERTLLKKVRTSQKKEESDDEEVLGFDEEDDDDEDSDAAAPFESEDDAAEADSDDGLPDSRAWGKNKRTFRGTDFVDPDYSSYNDKERELAELEQQEAENIQKRLAEELDDADFALDGFAKSADDAVDEDGEVPVDLSGLTKKQKLALFRKDSPEFEGLVAEMFKHLEESKDVLQPFLKATEEVKQLPIVDFAQTLNDLLLNFGNNVTFYLLLKAKRIPVKHHPVIRNIFQLRQLIEKLEERYTTIIKPQIETFMQDLKDDNVEEIITETQKERPITRTKKVVAPEVKVEDDEDAEITEKMDVESDEEEREEKEEHEKRKITYQMAKNKGLHTAKFKAKQRNPRVRNRERFKSAVKKRNKDIRPVQKEIQRYDGEQTGIKAYVRRSIKHK